MAEAQQGGGAGRRTEAAATALCFVLCLVSIVSYDQETAEGKFVLAKMRCGPGRAKEGKKINLWYFVKLLIRGVVYNPIKRRKKFTFSRPISHAHPLAPCPMDRLLIRRMRTASLSSSHAFFLKHSYCFSISICVTGLR